MSNVSITLLGGLVGRPSCRNRPAARTGRSWRQLPNDFAPWPTVYGYFTWRHDDGAVERIHDALRGQRGRSAPPLPRWGRAPAAVAPPRPPERPENLGGPGLRWPPGR
ncbi:transposase [Streptomyces antibioticus]